VDQQVVISQVVETEATLYLALLHQLVVVVVLTAQMAQMVVQLVALEILILVQPG
jgi:hypothetical protein